MDAGLRDVFSQHVTRRHYAAGQSIYQQNDPGTEMFRIVSGSVRMLVRRVNGREAVFALFESGDCFGDSSLVDEEPRPQTAEAIADVEVEVLNREAFDKLRLAHRAFDDALLKLLARQMRTVSLHYAASSISDLGTRIAARIIEAGRTVDQGAAGDTALSVHLSQDELALMVGASRQSVNRALQRLQAEGMIRLGYSAIIVTDLPRLQRAAGDE